MKNSRNISAIFFLMPFRIRCISSWAYEEKKISLDFSKTCFIFHKAARIFTGISGVGERRKLDSRNLEVSECKTKEAVLPKSMKDHEAVRPFLWLQVCKMDHLQ